MVSTLNSEFLRLPGGCLQSRDRKESRDKIEDSRKTGFRMPRSVAATAGRVWASSNRTSIVRWIDYFLNGYANNVALDFGAALN